MATERQIAANRRNAGKSTGPRSLSGKKRSSKNAFRHGLSKPLDGAGFARELEALTRQIVGDRDGRFAIELARSAADAELELARVRHFQTDLIEGNAAFRPLGSRETFRSPTDEAPRIMREVGGAPFAEKPERVEAIRLALPELARLARYEIRAAARRDRAIQALIKSDCKSERST